MNNNRTKYFHIDGGTSKVQMFVLLDTVQSDNDDEIDELINDSNTEFIALDEFKPTDNPNNMNVLTSEANIHAVYKGTTHTEELETNNKRKKLKESTPIT